MATTKKVLVVDDSPTQAKRLALLLQATGFVVEVAADGNKALELLRAGHFDLVLSDVVMPGLTGYELCQSIKGDPTMRGLPVILLTALNDPNDIMMGLSSGADNFITKPYQPQSLLDRINRVFSDEGAIASGSDAAGGTRNEFRFLGKTYRVQSSRQQILTFLLSTFEDYASAKLREKKALRRDMEHKRAAAELLAKKNSELVEVNTRLEEANKMLAQLNSELSAAYRRIENSYDDLKREQALREIETRRMEMELQTAQTVQRMLIPKHPPRDIPGFEFAFSYEPAAEIGGDWLGFFHDEHGHRLDIYIGDVTSHGVPSALVTAGVFSVFSTVRNLAERRGAPAQKLGMTAMLEVLDRVVLDMANERLFMTVLASQLDYQNRVLHIANAGHPPPFVIRSSQLEDYDGADRWHGIHSFSLPSSRLGDVGDKRFPVRTTQLHSGDLVVWFTDGVAVGVDDHAGERRFLSWVREVHTKPLAAIRAHVACKLKQCLGDNRPPDDISFIFARVL